MTNITTDFQNSKMATDSGGARPKFDVGKADFARPCSIATEDGFYKIIKTNKIHN